MIKNLDGKRNCVYLGKSKEKESLLLKCTLLYDRTMGQHFEKRMLFEGNWSGTERI